MGVLSSRIAVVLLLAAPLLGGCITSSSRPPPPTSKTEAAKYNMELGIAYLRQGNVKAAQQKLERAVKDDDELATAHTALGLVYERLGDQDAAERSYRRGVSLESSNPDALNGLAVFLCLQRQQPAEAMRYFDRALAVPRSKADTNRAMLNTNAGLCAKRLDLVRAETYLRDALAVDPNFREALVQLADVSFSRQNFLQARAFVERYLAAGEATPDALWLGVRIETALGEKAAARNYADRLRRDFPASAETGQLLESERNAG